MNNFSAFSVLRNDELLVVDGGMIVQGAGATLGGITGAGAALTTMNAANGAAAGAKKGAIFGPKGLVAGAAIGAVSGAIIGWNAVR